MSLHPHAPYPIPEETQRVARAAFPRGNLYSICRWPTISVRSTTTRRSRPSSPGAANRPKRQPA
jgi:hypothetical protein